MNLEIDAGVSQVKIKTSMLILKKNGIRNTISSKKERRPIGEVVDFRSGEETIQDELETSCSRSKDTI